MIMSPASKLVLISANLRGCRTHLMIKSNADFTTATEAFLDDSAPLNYVKVTGYSP